MVELFSNVLKMMGRGVGWLFQFGVVSYILIGLMIVAALFGLIYFLHMARKKKKQWTHKIKVRRLLQDGTLTPEIIIKMRRFPLEQGVEMFELEKAILGSYLIPQPGEYTGLNEFSIILDSNNRIYVNKGYKFNKDNQSIEVSAVHAGIDVEMSNMKQKWQQAHKVDKKLTTAELIKAGLKALGIVAIVILGIMGIKEWGQAQQYKAAAEQSQAQAMKDLSDAMLTVQATVNTQELMIIPMLKAMYETDNIAEVVARYKEVEGT